MPINDEGVGTDRNTGKILYKPDLSRPSQPDSIMQHNLTSYLYGNHLCGKAHFLYVGYLNDLVNYLSTRDVKDIEMLNGVKIDEEAVLDNQKFFWDSLTSSRES